MGALLGSLIGLGTGGLAGYAGEKLQQKHQKEAVWSQFAQSTVADQIKNNPDAFLQVANTPEGKKMLESGFDKEHIPTLMMMAQANSAARKASAASFQKEMGGAGAQMPRDLPSLQTLRDKYAKAMDDPALQDPVHQQLLKRHIDEADKAISEARQEQFHQEHEADLQSTREQTAAFRAEEQASREQARGESEDIKRQMLELKKTEDADKRQQQIATLGKGIDANRDKILADFAKTPTPAIKARVDSYNSTAGEFYRKHAGIGAPTLLKYSEEDQIGETLRGKAPNVEAVPPTYGNYKGKSGFIDADGYFYPDQD